MSQQESQPQNYVLVDGDQDKSQSSMPPHFNAGVGIESDGFTAQDEIEKLR